MIRRGLGVLVVAWCCLVLPASGQTPNPNEAALVPEEAPVESGPDPWVGYAACGFMSALAMFVVCKSARR
jgi:hypothetical protein